MVIAVGSTIPEATLMKRLEDKTNLPVDLSELLSGRKVALLGMPGAFTATCTGDHLPNVMRSLPRLKELGVDEIILFVVNDPQVVKAWGEVTGATDAGITLLADPESKLTEALGLRFDAPPAGLIGRCTRFASIVEDRVVTILKFEEGPTGCSMTNGDALIEALSE